LAGRRQDALWVIVPYPSVDEYRSCWPGWVRDVIHLTMDEIAGGR